MADRVSNDDAEFCARNHVGTVGREMILALLDERNALAKQRDELAVQLSEMRRDRDRQKVSARQWKADTRRAQLEMIEEIERADKAEAERDKLAEQYTTACKITDRIATERDAALAKAGAMREVAASERAKAEALRAERDAAIKAEAEYRQKNHKLTDERDAALARAGALMGRHFRCEGCGSITDKPDAQLEWIKSHGGTSCCPERKMVPIAPDGQAALDREA